MRNETAACWRLALERTGPCFFALTRQDLPVIDPATHDIYGGREQGRVCAGGRGEPAGHSDWHGLRSLAGAWMRRNFLPREGIARAW